MANEKISSLDSFAGLRNIVEKTGGTYSFNAESSVECFGALLKVISEMGYNPYVTAELRQGMKELLQIEIINMPDMNAGRYILAPNHVSDFDALVLGLLHPNIRIVSKTDWTENVKLRKYLDLHYSLVGLDRGSLSSLRNLLSQSVAYFNEDDENKHFLVFSQGTISDINNNSPERISTIAQKVSYKTEVPVVVMFIEQVNLDKPMRIVFDDPIYLSAKDDFRRLWLDRELALQNSLVPPARRPTLTQKHSNNNKPGDPFF